ncbi:MAG: hypothetical protein R2754_12980 [Microthrixaceae bacterium]
MTAIEAHARGTVGVLGDLLGLRVQRVGDPAATHLALPNAEHPRFYVPLLSNRAASASCLAYNRLRPSGVARRRSLVGWGLRSGVLQRLRGTPMVSEGAPAGTADEGLTLLATLRARLGHPELAVATSPRQLDPWWTPTLQLFEADGTPVGYAKVGWTALTNRQVNTETALLRRIAADPPAGFSCPSVLDRFEWGGAVVSVTAPMPADVTRLADDAGPFGDVLTTVAELDGPLRREPFASSGGATALDELLGNPNPGVPDEAWDALGARWRRIHEAVGDVEVALGRWHGDWVPWNLARSGDRLWVWDWEYSGPRRPMWLDAVHWHYQRARIVEGADLPEALAASRIRSAQLLDSLGVGADGNRVLATAHALELTLRSLDAVASAAPGVQQAAAELSTLMDWAVSRAEGGPT